MALIKEDGTNVASANTYASEADGDAYHAGHRYKTDWTGADATTREEALRMATTLIDSMFEFGGKMTYSTQVLQFPRQQLPNPDLDGGAGFPRTRSFSSDFPSNEVPAVVLKATCELARELIKADRTDDPDGEGIESIGLGKGAIAIKFNPSDRQELVPVLVVRMLDKVGHYKGRQTSMAKLVRT